MTMSSGGESGGGSSDGPSAGGRSERIIPTGQERTVSFQPEERYWTDYLRIALPVIGLLVLLLLLWWWANQFIGGSSSTPPMPPPIGEVSPTPDDQFTPSVPTSTSVGTPPPVVASAGTPPTATEQPQTDPTPVLTPTPGPLPDGIALGEPGDCSDRTYPEYRAGETVITSSSLVRVRAQASTASDIVVELQAGTPVEITAPFVAFDDPACDWWPISVNGQTGFVREDNLERAGP